jgi:hypothetical protein
MICTYRHHGEKDEASGRGFLGAMAGVNQAVDGGCREHQAAAEKADKCDVICLGAIRRDHDKDANDEAEEEH